MDLSLPWQSVGNARYWALGSLLFLGLLLPGSASLAGTTGETLFRDRIHPLLREHCFACHSHGADKIKGGLVLDSRAGLLVGGENGEVIVPGRPDQSRLVRAVRPEDLDPLLPPEHPRLTSEQVALLEEWVTLGAPWAEDATPDDRVKSRPRGGITEDDRRWWSFQPIREPVIPPEDRSGWARNPIDLFVQARRQREGLPPSPEADPATFIRRVTFDLTGLPPTPEEVAAFVQSVRGNRPAAVARLVDRLLASPLYGERWARHWLDLVRYAESDGYRVDDYRPSAWRYRDWVVRAFNDDLPYDHFVQAQLAGDELWPDDPQLARVATAFLRHWIYEYNNRDVRGQWQTILNDLTDVTGDVFLGLGVQCARCHDHKFDPILQKDYFRLQAFFAPLLPRQDLVVATAVEQAEYEARLARWREAAGDLLRQVDEFEAPVRQRAAASATSKFPEDIQALLCKPATERTPFEHQIAESAHRQITYEWARLETHLKGDEKERFETLARQFKEFEFLKPEPLPAAFTATDIGPEAPPVFLPRDKDGAPVEPGFLSVLDPAPARIERPLRAPDSTGRRTALARWLTSRENPLAARVLVNRVWQYHFGRGLAASSSDFGRLGELPTHPELLDWLAARFVRDGWSLKQLHRLIVTSATYGQAAETRPEDGGRPELSPASLPAPTTTDPENRLLSRFPTRRLEAEEIRDSIFFATGELDLAAGGPAVNTAKPRRTLYTRVTRNVRDPLLDVFDSPDNFASTAQRNVTTTPTQALLLINNPFLIQRAQAFARRIIRDAGDGDTARVRRAYELAFGRPPSAAETDLAVRFLADQVRQIPPEPPKTVPFLSEKMPNREGRAAVMEPGSAQERFVVPDHPDLPGGDFTLEAYVLLRSAPARTTHRTIAARWNGDPTAPGWALGVSGKTAGQKPQTLVLRLSPGAAAGSGARDEIVSSGVALELNKPYYVAAAVQIGGTNGEAVTFIVKDASNDCEPPQIVRATASVRPAVSRSFPFTIGALAADNGSPWDGLVDDIRLSRAALPVGQLLVSSDALPVSCVGWWRFEPTPGTFRDFSRCGNDIVPPALPPEDTLDPRTRALADFCHVLLNANEFLYTD